MGINYSSSGRSKADNNCTGLGPALLGSFCSLQTPTSEAASQVTRLSPGWRVQGGFLEPLCSLLSTHRVSATKSVKELVAKAWGSTSHALALPTPFHPSPIPAHINGWDGVNIPGHGVAHRTHLGSNPQRQQLSCKSDCEQRAIVKNRTVK